MSFSVQPKTLKKLVDYYYPNNHSEQMKYMLHIKGEEQLYMHLETSPFQGISSNSIEERILWFGKNQFSLIGVTKFSIIGLLKNFLQFTCLPLLLIFTGLSTFISYFVNFNDLPHPHFQGMLSLILTFINLLILSYIQFQKCSINQILNELTKQQVICEVQREGNKIQLKSAQIVVGDIVSLSIGSTVPADGWIFQGQLTVQEKHGVGNIKTKKADMKTCVQHLSRGGQNKKTKKATMASKYHNPRNSSLLNSNITSEQYSPIVLSGSSVFQGQAKMVVLCVGKLSKQGETIELLKINMQKTSIFQKKIQQFTGQIFRYTALLIIFLLIILTLKHIVIQIFFGNLISLNFSQLSFFLLILNMPIICIPQAIILGLAIVMIYHRKRLYWQKSIKIKNSIDAQSMAYVQYICHDKKQQKSYFKIKQWWNKSKIQIQNDQINQDDPQGNQEQLFQKVQDLNQKFQDLFRKAISITTHLKKSKNQQQRSQKSIKYGSFKNLDDCFVNYTKRKSYINTDQIDQREIIQEIPYDNIRKRTTVIASFQDFTEKSHKFIAGEQTKIFSQHQNKQRQFHEIKKTNQMFLCPPSIADIKMHSRRSSNSSNFSKNSHSSTKKQKVIIYIRGRHQTILDLCTHIMDKTTGQIKEILQSDQPEIKNVLESMMNRQLRAVLLAFKISQKSQNYDDPYGQQEKGYVLLAILGINDMRSTEQFQQLTKLKQLSINIMIASSTSTQNSISAANQTGIIKADDSSIIITGKQFLHIIGGVICKNCKKNICVCQSQISPKIKNSDQFERILKHLDVLSECQAFHKFALTTGLKNNNICNSLTAKQLSDLPALLQADVSIFIQDKNQNAQKQSKQIIKSICQIQLPNASILTLFELIKYSRLTHKFIRNYLELVITASMVGAIMFSASLFLFKSDFGLKGIQMLWLQLIFIGIALAFAFEDSQLLDPSSCIMSEPFKNYNKQLPFISKDTWKTVLFHIFLQIVILLAVMFLGQIFIPEQTDQIDKVIGSNWSAKYSTSQKSTICSGLPYLAQNQSPNYQATFQKYGIFSRHQTFMFNLFILMQIFNYFNCRKQNKGEVNIFKDLKVISTVIILAITIAHYIFLQNIGQIAGLYPYGLTFNQWMICICLSMLTWIFQIIYNILPNTQVQQTNLHKLWPNKSYNMAVRAVGDFNDSNNQNGGLAQFEVEQDYVLKAQQQ